jgi:hypothetical protein
MPSRRPPNASHCELLKPLQRLAKLLPEATSLLFDGGWNDVCFAPENLGCALRGERSWELLRSEKTEDRKQRRNAGTRRRDHEQHEFCRHGWKTPQ